MAGDTVGHVAEVMALDRAGLKIVKKEASHG